ncbi:DNA-dependent protein kinase catalytic subunit-like [Scleropages formosus]|uniref:DNA-dependent protein kinase catalytic subunit-like n=1 Tax=Scleropages formosus TaxID=113540 RepID=UPI0010FA9856|nr:DNA-dependent protein kinase catalytic subunit-like [Scleropages formosus]
MSLLRMLRDTRVEVLVLLETLVTRLSSSSSSRSLDNYAVDIKDTCLVVYTKDKAAKSRVQAVELLIKVLYTVKDSCVIQDFRVSDLFNKFYGELAQRSRLPDTVLGVIYELLGVLAEVYPGGMVNNSDKLFKAYMGELKSQMTSSTKGPKLPLVAGCLKGLTALMVNFTKSMEEDPQTSKEIFVYALKAISPQIEMKQYAVPFAGLRLFARHSAQFSSCFMEHYKTVFDIMYKWCGETNPEMKTTSYYALESFLKQVAALVTENVELHKSKLKFFMQKFCTIIQTMHSSQKELSIAIRGYGLFAAPCKVMCPQDVDFMYTELIQRCKQMYLTESDTQDDNVYQLPSFLDSIASVLFHLDRIPEVYTPVLEHLLVLQIDCFPQYSQRMMPTCCRSVVKVLTALAGKGPILWNFISTVLHQGVIRVCSKPLVLNEEDMKGPNGGEAAEDAKVHTGKWKVHSYRDYLPLFKALLDCEHMKDSGILHVNFEAEHIALKSLNRLLYDELIKSILKIVKKLDLSVQKINDKEEQLKSVESIDVPSSDPTAHLLPSKPNDFIAFVNLVEFSSELLLQSNAAYFEPWVYSLGQELILRSSRCPLVSGFYKLLSVTMKIAKKFKYFQCEGSKTVPSSPHKVEKSSCFTLFAKFGKEVSVRMKQFKDELLASCLTFVLCLDHNIVALDVKVYIPALQAAFKLGLSHLPLAGAALDALEEWSSFIPQHVLQPYYREVLPCLDAYLQTAGSNEEGQNAWEVRCLSSRLQKGYGKVLMRLLRKSKHLSLGEDSPSIAVKYRVVRLLGRLGGQLNRSMVTAMSSEEVMKKFVAWDSEKRLNFAVPFSDMKPVVYLDTFLPRITELAISSADRQTKVVACELLHSIVVYMLGKSSQIPDGNKSSPPMYHLHKRIFPVLLRLACDVDQVTRQLFEPLIMQLIHWFTSNKKFESQDTVAVVEAILDGLVDPIDSTLRDFSGRCIHEFFKWSLKQSTSKQQEKSNVNIKSIFKRIYSLALHPSVFKRLGAALAFNSFYRQFREEKSLVEQYVFEVLVIFVESLSLAHLDEKALGTLQQCGDAIDHLKKIIKHMAATLSQPLRRRIPRGFSPEQHLSLLDVVMWLLIQCGRPQTECRHKCMELFYEFVPLLPGNRNPALWLADLLLEKGVGFLISCFEGGGHAKGSSGLLSCSTLHVRGPFSLRATLQWMDMLLAALDCYSTFIGLHFLKPHMILDSKERSVFLKALQFFITELASLDIAAVERNLLRGQIISTFSPKEREDYNYLKGTIVVRLIEFVTIVLEKCHQDLWKLLEKDIFSDSFIDLVTMVVCEPATIGFNVADVEVMTNLPDVCVRLMKALVMSPYKHRFECSIRKKISPQSVERLCAVDLFDPEVSGSHTELDQLLSACKQLCKAGLLVFTFNSQADLDTSLGRKLLLAVYKGVAPREGSVCLPSMDMRSLKLADGLLQLALSTGGQTELMMELLLKNMKMPELQLGTSNQSCTTFSHGELFYTLFETTISSELLKNADSTVPVLMACAISNTSMVSSLLNAMLDHCFRERILRKSQGSKLVEKLLGHWSSLNPWWAQDTACTENKMATLTLLSKVLQIDASVCFHTGHKAFEEVFSTYTSILMDTVLPLSVKSHALTMLPFFTTLPEAPLAKLQGALELLVASHFPMQSHEFTKGSLDCNNYLDCVKKFLDALELSQSPMLLVLMAEVLCRDQKHIMEEQFQMCFKRIASRPHCDRQVQLLTSVFQGLQVGEQRFSAVNQATLERVLLPLLLHCSPDALRCFFAATVTDIVAALQSRFTKSNETLFESQVMKKDGCYKVMEVLYSRLPKDEVYSKASKINEAFSGGRSEGNELSKIMLKCCFEAFTENMVGETQLLEKRRRLHCAAYNCAIAVVACCFNETKFYQGFLFTEKPDKNQLIFENIVDTQRTYRFPVEVEVPLEKKKKYVTIRKEMTGEHGEGPQYLSSQSCMDSSLSEEMSQFDFSTGVQSFSSSFRAAVNHTSANRSLEQAKMVSHDETVELEMDELNQHECMTSMTMLLKHMQRNNITPKVEQGSFPSDLPPWMKFLHSKLSNPSTQLNIRLFIAKLIINAEEVFRPYAKFWLGPLLQLIVCGNNGGEGIHYMVVDVVVTVLSWTGLAAPKGNTKDEVLANRLLEFLMKNCSHQRRAVFRHNLEIIKTVVECWKDCLVVPYSLMYEQFAGTDLNSKDNSVGLQLLGIILANNLPPYDAMCEIEQERYIRSLVNNLSFIRFKEIYSTAAEIIGCMMQYAAEKNKEFTGPLVDLTASKLMDLKKNDKDDLFISCLSKICRHYPPFMDRFVHHVFFLLPKMHGVLKIHCLECVFSRATEIPHVYLELKRKDFLQMMGHRDEARQRVCLDIVHKILSVLKPEELREMLGSITSFITHPSPVCRERMYDILMWIYDNYSDKESQSDCTSLEVFNASKETLVQGLVDESPGLQLYVRNFWSRESCLPTATADRLLMVLRSLYSSKIEEHFLSLATGLLLEMTSRSPDYTRPMFEYPLSECKFQDYVIDSNWRHRSAVLTPMFVETQTSQGSASFQSQSGPASSGGPAAGPLRTTQSSLEFTPTQTAGKRSSYNWLTGRSVDTLSEYPVQSFSSESSSSLVAFGRTNGQQLTRKSVGAEFGTKQLVAGDIGRESKARVASEQQADILRLRRRFLKDQEKVSLHFAKKGIQEQRQEKEQIADWRLQKEAKVTLYRSYRLGELPDIQIEHRSIIAPLQALAQRDPIFAKQLFSSLFAGIMLEIESSKSAAERKSTNEELLQDMNNLLSKSVVYFPPFVACVQDMSYHHRELLPISPEIVSSSCLASLQQPIGILLLEENLVQQRGLLEAPAAKRSRREQPPDTTRWIHLAKLYRSLGDYDAVRGIFSGKIGTKPITRLALQAEAKSDFGEAVKLYNEALNTEEWMDGEPGDTEKDFWDLAALEAYSHLTEWRSLCYCATVNIDSNSPVNLDNVWTDSFYQEVYLPYLMRSMLKLLQQGERDQALLSFVDSAMKTEERKNVMETHYSQELSLLYILQEDYDRAKYYINNALQVFIQSYSTIDVLLNQSRLAKLQSVQPLTEVHDFLHFISGSVSPHSLKSLLTVWTSRYPDAKMDPMNVWDDIITTRCFFLDKIAERLTSSTPVDMEVAENDGIMQEVNSQKPENLNVMIKDCKFSMKLRMADSARKQNNFALATKLLKELHKEAKTESSWLQRWIYSFSHFNHKRSQHLSPVEQMTAMLKVAPLLEEIEVDNATCQVYLEQRILLGTTFCIMASAVSKDVTVLEKLGNDKVERLLKMSGSSSVCTQQMVVGLRCRALELLRSAVRTVDEKMESLSSSHMDTPEAIKAYMALANFCDQRLREEEKSPDVSEFPELPTFPALVVEMLIKALKLNSKEARMKFPRLLQIFELLPPETLSLMAKEVSSVPCWQLISWISQMMALLDKPEAVAVQQVIADIAKAYPQALVYPFMISYESYMFDNSSTGHRNKQFVARLKSQLDENGVVKDFVDALQQLTNPDMVFRDWWDSVKNELEKQSPDRTMIKRMFDDMFSALGDHRAVGVGSFRKKFIQRFAKEIEKLFGSDGSRLFAKKGGEDFFMLVNGLVTKMRHFQSDLKEPGNLKEYSLWMSNFRVEMLRSELEIPGQYDGNSKPLPEYHAKISGFDERVKVMTSIRKPKRLIIRGDDEREYPFLVKGGEDLRQDQRIEQLFSIMNTILWSDATCSQKNMTLCVYKVVPMTTRVGLIEWMENTCTLKDFLRSRMSEEERNDAERPLKAFETWLGKVAGKTAGVPRYAELYKKAKRDETVANFKKIENLVPEDLLRRAFIKMSTSPEAFLFLRSHFTASHALMCISHWLLGIGDRHLSNFLINMETGGMIGIDFGHAFGTATQFLPVPEMMPFRLTRQFLSLMQPMRESGLIQSTMVHCLRAYRASPDLLLNTMDIFVKEPSLDWKNFGLKQLKKGGTWTQSVNTKDVNWYPVQKVNFARRKLEGVNPAVITCEELQLGFEKDLACKGMLAVARGEVEHNVRAREADDGLSVETQVDCLLDQATDPNILGRVWIGWEAWI